MNKRTQKAFLMHSKHEDYKQRIKKAKQIIHECYKTFSSPYVSYSGGKDSTVLTHMVLQEEPLANIWHWDYGEELMPRDYEKEAIANLKQMGAKNITINKRKGNKYDTHSGYKQFFQQIINNKEKYGWDVGIVGVRQSESNRRKQLYKHDYFNDCCYPIRQLTVEDVWAYILEHKLPYHSTYELQGEYFGWENVRFVTFDDPEFKEISGYQERILL
jgi:3'-phosphoadenosine 5'-phosphosulfate sulfotransferase (PAPS reductase)/FAD synthetase